MDNEESAEGGAFVETWRERGERRKRSGRWSVVGANRQEKGGREEGNRGEGGEEDMQLTIDNGQWTTKREKKRSEKGVKGVKV